MRNALRILVFAGQLLAAVVVGIVLAIALHAECLLIAPQPLLVAAAIVTVAAGFLGFSAAIDSVDRWLAAHFRRRSTP